MIASGSTSHPAIGRPVSTGSRKAGPLGQHAPGSQPACAMGFGDPKPKNSTQSRLQRQGRAGLFRNDVLGVPLRPILVILTTVPLLMLAVGRPGAPHCGR